jgi:hypothetical protein
LNSACPRPGDELSVGAARRRPPLIRDPHHSLTVLPALILAAVVQGSSGQ